MKCLIHMLAVPVLALASVAGPSANAAQAQGYGYALTTIENPTNQTLHYSIQWGDGRSVSYTLTAGQYRTHFYEYGPEGHYSPPLRIRFDCTLCDDEFVAKEYVLDRYAHHSVDRLASKRYVFRILAGGCSLDLFGVN